MQTETNSVLKQSALGCVLALMLLQGSLCAQTRVGVDKTVSASGGTPVTASTTQQNDITGTWNLSIRYTGGDDRSNHVLKRKAKNVSPSRDMSPGLAAPNNVGQWITARFIAVRVQEPRPGNLTFVLKQEGEKVTGTYSAPGGRQKLTGTVKGKDVSFSVAVTNNAGEQITAHFTGEVPSPSKVEGTVTFDPRSLFNVTGTSPKRMGAAGQN